MNWLFGIFVLTRSQANDINVSPFADIDTNGRKFDEFRTIDGSNNNILNPDWGKAGGPIIRFKNSFSYEDNVSKMSGNKRPSARMISNNCGYDYKKADIKSDVGLSDMSWQWGQFLGMYIFF